jgi:two-component system, OmpR family, KDP operon response regulator KdpE
MFGRRSAMHVASDSSYAALSRSREKLGTWGPEGASALSAGAATREREPAVTVGAGPLLLVVDDEASMQKMLRIVLCGNGFRTVEGTSAAQALAHASAYNPDLVLLDLGLPDSDGLEVARRLREWSSVPILVISARGAEQEKIAVFDAGANDYLMKPFTTGELLARIRVWLRHMARIAPDSCESVLDVGELRIDFARRLAFVAGREVHLTATEYKLFAALMRHEGCVMTSKELLTTVWGPHHSKDTQYLRNYMGRLRRLFERDPARPRYLVTETGVGYRLRDADLGGEPHGPFAAGHPSP